MKIKVKATNQYEHPNVDGLPFVIDDELKRIPKEGEVFEVTEERYHKLHGNNNLGLVFVEKVNEKPIKEAVAPKPKKETAKKKTTKK